MSWDDVLKIITSAIAAAGGAGAILYGIVKFASNSIAEKMMKKYDAKLQKEIEQYKHGLEIEAEKYRAKNENIRYVTQRQFDTEFTAYQTIFDNMYTFAICVGHLFPVIDNSPPTEDEEKTEYMKRYDEYRNAFNTFSEILEKNAAFIPKENYDIFSELRSKARELGIYYPELKINKDMHILKAFEGKEIQNFDKTVEFNKLVEKSKDTIREYLLTLRVYTE